MKLAILLFGHLRTFKTASGYFIENVVNQYDCDIFMHTWDETDSTTQAWNSKLHYPVKTDESVIKNINMIYKPKALSIGHQNNTNDEIIENIDESKKLSLNGIRYMFESMRTANELRKSYEKENNIKYDYILVTRPDVAVYNFLDIPAMIEEASFLNIDLDNARFFAGHYGDSKTNVRLLCSRPADILFFARSSVIDRYISANQSFDKHKLNKTFCNVCSIFARNEIRAGIQPVQICFAYGTDWKNVPFKSDSDTRTQTTFMQKIFSVKNEYSNGKKHKAVRILGLKITFKQSNNR